MGGKGRENRREGAEEREWEGGRERETARKTSQGWEHKV